MSAHPDEELLSAHADGAAGARAAGVEEHLSGCGECRRRLAELRAVSKLVADLPKKELPAGFLARLERRRREEEAPATRLLPGLSPMRLAAFAATGLLVGLVFFREVRYRLAPQMLDAAGGSAEFRSEFSVGRADDAEADEAAVEAARRAAAARGAWSGLAAEAPAQAVPETSGGAGDRAMAKAELKGGAPMGSAPSSTNEEIHGFLEKERKRMGIQDIVPPAAPSPADAVPDRPLSKQEAMDVMRSMTRQLSRINREAADKRSPTVALGGGSTPALLGAAEPSRPMAEAEVAPAAEGRPALAGKDSGLSMVRGARGMRVDQPAGFGFDAERSNAAKPAARKAAPKASEAALPRDSARSAAPARTLAPRASWSAASGGLGEPGGAVLTSAEDWADLWKRVGRAEPLPAVDFSKEMVVAVFGARDEASARSVEIVSLAEEGGSLVIRYRAKTEAGAGPSAPYHAVAAPKSALPFSFVQVP